MEKEIWKDVKGYEGYYQVSSLGNVRSLDRIILDRYGNEKIALGQIIKKCNCKIGYHHVGIHKLGKRKTRKVHQLVAEAFLNHIPCGRKLVVNHINFNKKDNRVKNLEIVTTRENSNKKHLNSSSKYIGVSLHKLTNKWMASIHINGKHNHLGLFINEYDAHLAYQKALKEIL